MRPLILGIDPGFKGAIAVLNEDTKELEKVIDIPVFKTASKSRKSGFISHVDAHRLAFELDLFTPDVSIAVIEDVGAMTGEESGRSMFGFGKATGTVWGVLAGLTTPVVPVRPEVWKMSIGISSDKETSRALASELFPQSKWLWKLKKHTDRAEAALIAWYAHKNLQQVIKKSREL